MVDQLSNRNLQDYSGRVGITPDELEWISRLEPGAQRVGAHLGNVDAFGLTPEQRDTKIEELNLPVRAWHGLRRGGIETVGQLLGRNSDQLLSLREFGPISYMDTLFNLAEKGLVPKDQPPQE